MCSYVTSEDESLEPIDCEITFRPIDKSKKIKVEGYFDYRVKEINPSTINHYWVKIPEEYSELLNSRPDEGFECVSETMLDLFEFLIPYMSNTLFYVEENGKYYQLGLDEIF